MKPITWLNEYNDTSEDWLCTVLPNWAAGMQAQFGFMVSHSKGLSEREASRAERDTWRVEEFTFSTWMDGRVAREWQAELAKKGIYPWKRILVPYWPAARPVADFPNQKVRGEIYVQFEMDQDSGEMVNFSMWRGRTTLSTGTPSADAWVAPLLVCHFAEQPDLDIPDDELVEINLSFKENAAWVMRLEVIDNSPDFSLGYPALPDVNSKPILPFAADWKKAAREKIALGYEEITLSKERLYSVNYNETLATREIEYAVSLLENEEIEALLGFWQWSRGVERMWTLSPLSAARLASDIGAATNTFSVTEDETLALNRTYALLDVTSGRMQAFTLTSHSPGTVVCDTNVSDFPQHSTVITELIYSRFSKNFLKITWDTDNTAECEILTRELPWETEYVPNEIMGTRETRASFYGFIDTATGESWQYTSYEQTLNTLWGTYISYPITHGDMKKTLTLSDECEVTAVINDNTPFIKMLRMEIPSLEVYIGRHKVVNGVLTGLVSYMQGYASNIRVNGKKITFTCKAYASQFDQIYPRMRFTRLCTYALFSQGCGLSKSTWEHPVTVLQVTHLDAQRTELLLQFAWNSGAPANFWAWGSFTKGVNKAQITSSPSYSGTTITLIIRRPSWAINVNDVAKILPECDGRMETCKIFGNYANFGGNMVANGNLSLIKVGTNQTSGGKK